MSLAKIKDNVLYVYPYTFSTLLQENPHTQFTGRDVLVLFPQTEQGLAGYTLVEVTPTPRPAVNPTRQEVLPVNPIRINDVWTQQWSVVDFDAEVQTEKTEAERLRLCEEIKKIRDQKAVTGGWKLMVGEAAKWFHSDIFSRTQHAANARKADRIEALGGDTSLPLPNPNSPGQPLLWKTMDKSFVVVTGLLAQELMVSAEKQEAAIFTRSEVLQYMVMTSVNPTEVDITVGWPEVFVPAIIPPT